jgi:hypothetical protein
MKKNIVLTLLSIATVNALANTPEQPRVIPQVPAGMEAPVNQDPGIQPAGSQPTNVMPIDPAEEAAVRDQLRQDINKMEAKSAVPVPTNQTPVKPIKNEKIKKVEDKNYELVLKLLQTKEKIPDTLLGLENEEAREAVKEKSSEKNEEILKMLLPIPKKSMTMGNKVIVFAEYRERTLSETPSATLQRQQMLTTAGAGMSLAQQMNTGGNMNTGNPLYRGAGGAMNPMGMGGAEEDTTLLGYTESDIEYEKKEIRLKEGSEFGNWIVHKLEPTVVTYKNKSSGEELLKYY